MTRRGRTGPVHTRGNAKVPGGRNGIPQEIWEHDRIDVADVSGVGWKTEDDDEATINPLALNRPTRYALLLTPGPCLYNLLHERNKYIRPQGVENRASRPLSRTQATRRDVSSWVGDHQRIPSVLCPFPYKDSSLAQSQHFVCMAAADLFIDMNNNMEDERPKIQTGRPQHRVEVQAHCWGPVFATWYTSTQPMGGTGLSTWYNHSRV
ncbi:hypothetical protein ASPNIDRAFT_37299 [Aspergillus niger ATCC 1015]|uniref:Uncharacterized protein n=1 Tax=Aspergillus niger (strain ATCC 1015 / CBS 113.46 / FGSC A1144 / LSHB Ac4 / NCTC 3858a / NRRL 328 / USDA 3528.7) TaxID=380704 RepID=G3Y147_ASPNA|nr:hypothetical protein ASPNIDRAFT_37299 [Aspergillus niger ATCC 1015]